MNNTAGKQKLNVASKGMSRAFLIGMALLGCGVSAWAVEYNKLPKQTLYDGAVFSNRTVGIKNTKAMAFKGYDTNCVFQSASKYGTDTSAFSLWYGLTDRWAGWDLYIQAYAPTNLLAFNTSTNTPSLKGDRYYFTERMEESVSGTHSSKINFDEYYSSETDTDPFPSEGLIGSDPFPSITNRTLSGTFVRQTIRRYDPLNVTNQLVSFGTTADIRGESAWGIQQAAMPRRESAIAKYWLEVTYSSLPNPYWFNFSETTTEYIYKKVPICGILCNYEYLENHTETKQFIAKCPVVFGPASSSPEGVNQTNYSVNAWAGIAYYSHFDDPKIFVDAFFSGSGPEKHIKGYLSDEYTTEKLCEVGRSMLDETNYPGTFSTGGVATNILSVSSEARAHFEAQVPGGTYPEPTDDEVELTLSKTEYRVEMDTSSLTLGQPYELVWVERFVSEDGSVTNDVLRTHPFVAKGQVEKTREREILPPTTEGTITPVQYDPDFIISDIEFEKSYLPPGSKGNVSEMWAKASISNLKDPAKKNEYLKRVKWKISPYKDNKVFGVAAKSQGLTDDEERALGTVIAGEEVGKVYVIAYDSKLEGIYHAEVLEISCSSCKEGDCGVGSGATENECVELAVNMGRNADGSSLGNIILMEKKPSAYTYTPFALQFSAPAKHVATVLDEHGALRQIKTDEALLDITVPEELELVSTNQYFITNGTSVVTNTVIAESTAGFEMSFYQLDDVSESNGTFVVDAGAVPFKVWRVEDPDRLENSCHRVKISEISNGAASAKTNVNTFIWNETVQGWDLSSGDGLQVISRSSEQQGATRIETFEIQNGFGNVASKTQSTYVNCFWGEALVEEVQDPDGAALVTDYTYYTDESDKERMGKMESVKYPNSSWVKYFYDDEGRRSSVWSPWLDVTLEQADDSNCRRKDTSYEPVDPNDLAQTNGYVILRPRLVTEFIAGTAVKKTAYVCYTNATEQIEKTVEYDDPVSGSYADAANRISTSIYYLEDNPNADLADKLKRTETANGLVASYGTVRGNFSWTAIADGSFTFGADTNGAWLCETVTNGTVSSPAGVANKTTMTVSYRNSRGGVALTETHVYTGSSYERINWTASEFDYDLPQYQDEAVGHVMVRYFPDGTKEENNWSSCCGLESVVSRQGQQEIYNYDALGRRDNMIRLGAGSQPDIYVDYGFDAAGRQKSMTESGGGLSRTTGNSYDLAGRLKASTNEAGLVTSYTYQDGGRISTVTLPGGTTQITETYIDGRTKRIYGTGAVEQTYEYGFDGSDLWTKVYAGPQGTSSPRWEKTITDADGKTLRTERPGFGGTLLSTVYHYDAANRLWKTEQLVGATVKTATLTEYNELGNAVRSGLDVNLDDRLDLASMDRIVDSDSSYWNDGIVWWGKSVSITYPKDNNAFVLTNAVSKTRLTGLGTQSALGNLQSEMISVDVFGNETVVRARLDRATKTVTQIVDISTSIDDQISTTVNGLLQSIQSASSAGTTSCGYDGLGRQTTVVDPRIGTSTTHYNAKGQIDWTEDTHGVVTTNVYHSDSGLLAQRHVVPPSGGSVSTYFDYDDLGNLVHQWGSATYPVAYDYDEFGQKTHLHTYRGGSGWDSTTWPGDSAMADTTEWIYDSATGLLTGKLYADGKGPSYTYWADGKLKTRTWARLYGSSPMVTSYEYDSTGELKKTDYSDATPDISYTYYRTGQQKTVTDAQGVHSFEYTDEGLLDVEKLDGVETIDRKYDGYGRSAGYDVDDASSFVSYGYDSFGRFSAITSSVSSVSSVVNYSYVPGTSLLSGYTAGTAGFQPALSATKSYESDRNLIVGITNQIIGGPHAGVVSSFTYMNDDFGRRTRRDDVRNGLHAPGSTLSATYWDFGYNARSELTNAVRRLFDAAPVAGQSTGYVYDNIGNRRLVNHQSSIDNRKSIYTANALNQYVARTVPSYVDIMGSAFNIATVTVRDALHNELPSVVTRQSDYFYKAYPVNNLTGAFTNALEITAVINPAGTNDPDIVETEVRSAFVPQTPEQFVYDDDGNLLSDGRFTYTWNAENRLITVSNETGLVASYKYDYQGRRVSKTIDGVETVFLWNGNHFIGEYSASKTNVYTWGSNDHLVSATLSGANVFYAHDGNKNVTDLIDASGNTVAHYEFDPSGNINVKTGALADTNPFRFSNEYSDEETGHIAYMLRYCNLGVGGWLNRDPIQEKGGANLYGFVQNNPVSLVDQNGQKAYLVYRPFDGALLKWGYPLIGHYYLAFDDTFSGNSAGLKKRWEQDVKSLSSSAYDRFLITFSFHPLEVRYSLLGDVQEGAGRIVSAFVTSGSFVAINDSKDQAAYTRATKWFGLGRGRTDTITDDYCEQLELFKQAVKSANSNNGGSPDPGVYQVLNRNCGTWAQLIINRAKLSYPLHEAVTGNAGGGIGGLSDITHTGDVITETFRSLYEAAEWADKTSESIFNAMGGFTFGWGAVK